MRCVPHSHGQMEETSACVDKGVIDFDADKGAREGLVGEHCAMG